MVRTASGDWKRDPVGRPILESVLAWLGVMILASVVFTGLYLIVASLE